MQNDNGIDYMKIQGWGIDADPENQPAYPMRDLNGQVEEEIRPAQQEQSVELLQSNERPALSAVFGTSVPPAGLSGFIRRKAFKHSEASWAHWFMLLFADRVNVVEGILHDLWRGRVPNIFAEMGLKAEWKYNRKAFVKKYAELAVFGAGLFIAFNAMRKR